MYGKMFVQMYDGTLATRGPWQALVTFQQLITLANRHGEVDMTAEVLSRRTTIPLDIILLGLAELSKPDPGSRTPECEGRRIVPLDDHRDWGWRIVNYALYAKIRSDEERREYFRQHKAKTRSAKKKLSTPVHNVTHTDVDVDVDVDSKAVQERLVAASGSPIPPNPVFKKQPRKIGTRLAEDWFLPDDWKAMALALHPDWTPQGVIRESATFRDYWHAKSGKDAVKMDWKATWRTWIRRAEKEPVR